MENLRTVNYTKKRIVNFLFNEKWYNRIKLAKIIVSYKMGIPYEMSPLFKHLLTKDSVVFDIGANMRQYACRLNNIVSSGHGQIYSFEPVSTNFYSLKEMKKILSLDKVSILQLGVSNIIGNTTINIPMFDNGLVVGTRATLSELDEVKHKSESIKVTTIDSFFSEMRIKKVDFIKCDTEGNENNVLEGGKQTIASFLPILSFEMSHKSENLEWLLGLGYELFYYDSEAKLLRKIRDTQKGNLIFLNRDHTKSLQSVIEHL